MRARIWIGAAAAAMLALPAASGTAAAQRDREEWLRDCERDRDHREREHVCEVREHGMRARGGTIVVDPGVNGGAYVEGWDRDSVHIEARIQAWASTESAAREIARGVTIDTEGTISADGPPSGRRGWSVIFVMRVPTRSDLSIEATNGPVSVARVAGRMRLEAQNGPIRLDGVGGDVRVRAQNGPLSVTLAGTRWEGVGLDAETVNGPATLTLPENFNARLETGTVNGPMNIDFPIVVQGRISRHIETQLGDGGPPIRVVTTNGPVVVRRR
jgi:hypothetical protein